jgi:class 3 adenylate cyclase
MARLNPTKRASLPDSAFAYVDSKGRRRLPINDESHVRNALSRFNQVAFESDQARERARQRLLKAAKKHKIMPFGFITGELEAEQDRAAAGRLVIDLDQVTAPGELEERLRMALKDPTLLVLYWSESSGAYLDSTGRPVAIPNEEEPRCVTYLERRGQPMTAILHDTKVLKDPNLANTVMSAVRYVIDKEGMYGQVEATTTDTLPSGFMTMLMTDIEGSTDLLKEFGDGYATLLAEIRSTLRKAILRANGRQIEVRADEFFAVFEQPHDALKAATEIQRVLVKRARLDKSDVRVRIGIHSGCPTLTEVGYIGLAIHTVARVSDAAHGGQILVSGDTISALGEADTAGLRFRSLGPHLMQGLPNEEELFQVEAQGLLTGFPPPRIGRSVSPDPWD